MCTSNVVNTGVNGAVLLFVPGMLANVLLWNYTRSLQKALFIDLSGMDTCIVVSIFGARYVNLLS